MSRPAMTTAFGIAIMLSAILAPILKKTGSAARKLY